MFTMVTTVELIVEVECVERCWLLWCGVVWEESLREHEDDVLI